MLSRCQYKQAGNATNAKIVDGGQRESVKRGQLRVRNDNVASFIDAKGHCGQQGKNDKVDSADRGQAWGIDGLQGSQVEQFKCATNALQSRGRKGHDGRGQTDRHVAGDVQDTRGDVDGVHGNGRDDDAAGDGGAACKGIEIGLGLDLEAARVGARGVSALGYKVLAINNLGRGEESKRETGDDGEGQPTRLGDGGNSPNTAAQASQLAISGRRRVRTLHYGREGKEPARNRCLVHVRQRRSFGDFLAFSRLNGRRGTLASTDRPQTLIGDRGRGQRNNWQSRGWRGGDGEWIGMCGGGGPRVVLVVVVVGWAGGGARERGWLGKGKQSGTKKFVQI